MMLSCNKLPWISGCLLLLLMVLVGTIVPIQSRKPQDETFVIEDETIEGVLHTKVLKNTETGEYVEVVLDYGGRVEDLHLKSRSGEKVWPVLLTENGNASAIIENVWSRGMLLLPWANRIAYGRYEFFGESYQLPVNEYSSDPIRMNALHGFMANKVMDTCKIETTSEHALLGLSYFFEGNEQGYPFLLDVRVFYKLDTMGFTMSFEVTNQMSKTPLPFYVGWHPYFLCTTHKAYVILDQCLQWNHVELNSNADPTGNTEIYYGFDGTTPIGGSEAKPTSYDDEFKPRSGPSVCDVIETQVHDTETDHTIVLWQDSSFRLVHIFTVEKAIAVEPMSAMADAYNNHDHLTVLSGGETWSGSFGVYIK